MILKKVTRNLEDGTVEIKLELTEEQTQFLLNFAIGFLVQQGTVRIFDLEEGQEVPETEVAKEFLENIETEKLHKA